MANDAENLEETQEIPFESDTKPVESETEFSLTTVPISKRDTINAKAKEAREARKLPTIPGYAPSVEQAEEWFKLLDDDMWSHTAPYVYRVWPKIVRQLSDPDNKNYIDIICKEHVDKGLIAYLKATHGGGTFKMMVVDLDTRSARGNSKAIMEFSFKIDSNEYPPILNLKEIDVSHKPNMGFINQMVSKGLMDSKGNVMQPNQAGTNGNPAELAGQMGQMFDRFMSMYAAMDKDKQATINKILGEGSNKKDDGIQALLLEKLKQDNPNNQVDMLVKLMALMQQPKQDDSLIKLLITQMQDSSKNQLEFMKMMMNQSKPEPVAPVEKEDFIDKLMRYREALPELFGGGRVPKKEMGELILDGAKEFVLPLLGIASQFMQLKGAKPIIPVTEQQAREFVTHGVPVSQQAQQQHQAAENERKILPMPNPGQPQPILDPHNLTPCQELILKYGQPLVEAINRGDDGVTIADNLEAAAPVIGNIYGMLVAQGKEEILKAMESIPEFWDQTGKKYGKGYMEQLITDFLSDPEEDETPEGTEGQGA